MNRALRFAVLPALAAVLAAGCTTWSPGSTQYPVTPSASGTPASVSAPSRPREIHLDGRDPCAVIPRVDWPQFDIVRPGVAQQEPTLNSPACLYGTNTGGAEIILVVTEGIERWTDGSRRAEAHEEVPIEGFPTISLTLPTEADGCDVAVDVAPGQYLYAAKVVIPDGSGKTLPAPCDWAHQLAESAMGTLVRS